MANQEGKEIQPFVADAMDPLGADSNLLAKMIFAENAPGGPEAWAGIGNVALNRLKSGRFGKSLKAVINGMSSAIKTKSKQWEKASNAKFNDYEQRVFNKIAEITDGLVGGKIPDSVNGATHFENLRRYPLPYWAKDMDAVKRIGGDTYFKEKNYGNGQGEHAGRGTREH
jgi:spore germination cell wall hydrolase CwlJ-like protein